MDKNGFWKGKRVFCTGASGFLGQHLCKRLKEEGADVLVLVHKKEMPEFASVKANLVYGYSLWLELQKFKPEVVFHLAAQPLVGHKDSRETLETNIRGTYAFYDMLRRVEGIQSIIHVSTDKVMGGGVLTNETPLCSFDEPYATSKLCGDAIAQMYCNFFGLPITVVRHANVYGPGDTHWERLIPGTIKSVIEGKAPVIRSDGTFTRDYLYVDDVIDFYLTIVRATIELRFLGQPDPVLIGAPVSYSVLEVVDAILDMMNNDLKTIVQNEQKNEIHDQHVIGSLVCETSLEKGLQLTAPWYYEYLKGERMIYFFNNKGEKNKCL